MSALTYSGVTPITFPSTLTVASSGNDVTARPPPPGAGTVGVRVGTVVVVVTVGEVVGVDVPVVVEVGVAVPGTRVTLYVIV